MPMLAVDEEAAQHAREVERIHQLREVGILDSQPQPEFDHLVRLAAQAAKMPIALISFVDQDRQWFKANLGLDTKQTPRTISFCGHAVASRKPLIVEDVLADPRFSENPLVHGEPHFRSYFGFPIFLNRRHAIGTLCVIDRQPRVISKRVRRVLRGLARQVELEVDRFQRVAELARHAGQTGSIADTPPGLEIAFRFQLYPEFKLQSLTGDAEKLLGRPQVSSALGEAESRSLIHQQDRSLLRFFARRPKDLRRPLLLRWRGGDDRFRWLTNQLSPIFDGGRPVAVEGTATAYAAEPATSTRHLREAVASDDLHAALASRNNMLARLRTLQRQKTELLALTVHDMKTPLTAIIANASLLRDSAENDETARALDDILSNAEVLDRLALDMLDVGSAEQGQLSVRPTTVDIAELIGEVVQRVHTNAAARQQRISWHPPSDERLIQVDGHLLERVLQNLLDNACRYSPDDSEIRILLEESPLHCRITVSDEGPGVAPELRDAIFEPYAQANIDFTRRGHGLGLAFCHQAVLAHNGKIWIDGSPSGGASFIVELPRNAKA